MTWMSPYLLQPSSKLQQARQATTRCWLRKIMSEREREQNEEGFCQQTVQGPGVCHAVDDPLYSLGKRRELDIKCPGWSALDVQLS